MENVETFTVLCEGGLDSNENFLLLADRLPGGALTLVNFEPSLFGGYRKLSGFTPLNSSFPEIDADNAEGRVLGLAFHGSDIIAARKQQSGSVYKFYKFSDGNEWDDYTTGLTLTSTNVSRIRYATYNFDGTDEIVFADGVNGLIIFDNTNWGEAATTGTGADLANAGGDQALDDPKYVTVFRNHIFVSGDASDPHIVAHSAPFESFNWEASSGAGQIIAGFKVVQIKPFRDALYVFGTNQIKKIVVDGDTFTIQDVTTNLGCIAPDSVIEFNGDLLFLSQDGFRTIAATERNEDLEIGVQSKIIQQDLIDLITAADLNEVNSVVIRRKSQFRCFFADQNIDPSENVGVLGALRGSHPEEHQGHSWEWGRLQGIRSACAASNYIETNEYVIHGDYNGKVYRQEMGDDFDGDGILAIYQTPYFDLGDIYTRKTLHKITVFVRPEAELSLSTRVRYDWGNPQTVNPAAYILESLTEGDLWGEGVWGTAKYANAPEPILIKNVEGSGFSFSLTFTSNDTGGSFSIQSIVFEYKTNGRK